MRDVAVTVWLLSVLVTASPAGAQTTCEAVSGGPPAQSPLPPPTGPASVGRTAVYLPASSGDAGVDLMLHIWYPAEAVAGQRASYLAGWDGPRDALTARVRRLFQDAYCEFERGRILSFASENAPVSKTGRFPVLLFAHGLGVPTSAYTAQLEDLASHGYVVVAVEYSPAASFVLFPDGRVGAMDAERWNAIARLPMDSPELIEFERTEIDRGARAIRTVVDYLERANASGPLAGQLDVERLGAFGHSFGAMMVLRALQTDRRLRAGMTQDALGPAVLAYAAAEGKQMTARVALFFRPVGADNRPNVERLLRSLPGGTLLVTPSSPGFAHMSFSDMPLLRAGANADTRASATRNLAIVRALTRTFFDSALRGSASKPTELPASGYRELTIDVSSE